MVWSRWSWIGVVLAGLAAAWWFVTRSSVAEPHGGPPAAPSIASVPTESAKLSAPQDRSDRVGPAPPAAAVPDVSAAAQPPADTGEAPSPESAPARPPAVLPRLVGSLVVPAGFAQTDFKVGFRRPGSEVELPIRLLAGGEFRLFEPEPGDITVVVRALGDPQPLRSVPVRLPESGSLADPRLQKMTFPELRVVELELLTPEGGPVTGDASAVALGSHRRGQRVWTAGGKPLAVKARYRPQRVVVWAQGFARAEVDVDDRARVTLLPPAEVSLAVTIEADALADGAMLIVSIELDDESLRGAHVEAAALGRGARGGPNDDGGPGDFLVGSKETRRSGLLRESPTEPLEFTVGISAACHVTWQVLSPSVPLAARRASGVGPSFAVAVGERSAQSFRLTKQMVEAAAAAAKSAAPTRR